MKIKGQGIGSTIVDSAASIAVEIRVRAPSWAKVDRLKLYLNSVVVHDVAIATGTDFTTTLAVTPTTDSWVVAEVIGTQNMFPVISPVEFPPLDATIILGALSAGGNGLDLGGLPATAKLQPKRTHIATPYAITNPIWIDRDGSGWTPPKGALPKQVTSQGSRPDVRTQFDALPELFR
jgi:hypothetical protein